MTQERRRTGSQHRCGGCAVTGGTSCCMWLRNLTKNQTVKPACLFLNMCIVIALSGCVVPVPFRSYRTPELSGRVIDSASKAPLSGAVLSFVMDDERTPLGKPQATTDATGHFHLAPTFNFHAGGVFMGGHGGSSMWPEGEKSGDLRVEHSGYSAKIIDLRAAFAASGLANPDKPMGDHLSTYRGLLPLGDIPLKK